MNKTISKEDIQKGLDILATMVLMKSGEHLSFTEEDLFNATTIFSAVMFDLQWTYSPMMSMSEHLKRASETGQAIRKVVYDSTGRDMHQVAEELLTKE